MARILKIFDDEKEIYSGTCSVNTVLFKGIIFDEFKDIGTKNNGLRFSLKVSNGKDETTGEWKKPTFADCSAFGKIAEKTKKEYQTKDEIFVIAKYYQKEHEGRYYKGFVVKQVIQNKKEDENPKDDYLPF